MTLVPGDLQSQFRGFLATPPTSLGDASLKWANAYFTYALKAQALDAVPTAALNASTVQPLATLFSVSMVSQTFLTDMSKNLTVFWTKVAFVGVNNGPVSLISGAPALDAAVVALGLANQKNRGSAALDDLALAMHAFTQDITVALVNPTGVVIPTLLL